MVWWWRRKLVCAQGSALGPGLGWTGLGGGRAASKLRICEVLRCRGRVAFVCKSGQLCGVMGENSARARHLFDSLDRG